MPDTSSSHSLPTNTAPLPESLKGKRGRTYFSTRPCRCQVKNEPRCLGVKEAARYLGVTVWFIRSMIWEGTLPVIRCGKRFIVDRVDLDAWLEQQKGKAA